MNQKEQKELSGFFLYVYLCVCVKMTHILHSPLSSTSCLHCTVYNKQALPTLCLIFRPQPLSTATCLPSNAPHAETPTHGLNFRHSL